MHSHPRRFLEILGVLGLAASLQAAPITSFIGNYGTPGMDGPLFSGQSITTPGGGPWDNITFSFFGAGGTTPHATGTLYLLSQPYAGTPAALNNAVPGFLASTSNIVADSWVFDSALVIRSGTPYFLFGDSPVIAAAGFDRYPGGQFYASFATAVPFTPFNGDAFFSLNGNPVPETKTAWPIAAVLLALAALRPRK